MSEGELTLRDCLMDPEYWRPRLQRLSRVPRQLVVCPRPELSKPGIEVLELRLQAHDEQPIRALLGHSSYARRGDHVRLHPGASLERQDLDWASLEGGGTDVAVAFAPGRRLEDRVLDVLRVAEAVSSLESVESRQCRLGGSASDCEDEFLLARLLLERGWI